MAVAPPCPPPPLQSMVRSRLLLLEDATTNEQGEDSRLPQQ